LILAKYPIIFVIILCRWEAAMGCVRQTRTPLEAVKPIALMQWLCRLVTPPGGTVLDPFAGSGSTGVAALVEGFAFIGIEREAEYVAIARARLDAVPERLL
jgi:DNA modification methylase